MNARVAVQQDRWERMQRVIDERAQDPDHLVAPGRLDGAGWCARCGIGLSGPGYHSNRSNKLVLESEQDMAKRGEASPDDADALALTFAQQVAPVEKQGPLVPIGGDFYGGGGDGWMAG